jgi:[ribosomal protein S5]-alanine N-acetyltransferase
MDFILESRHLRLRHFTHQDASFILKLVNSEGWLTFIGDRKVKTIEQAITYLDNGPLKSYKENGFGLSLVELKSTNEPIGMCGLLKRPSFEHPDIGYAFLPEYTGKGYATEMAKALIDFAGQHWHLTYLYAITTADNHASINVLNKVGMMYEKLVVLPDNPKELQLYSVRL